MANELDLEAIEKRLNESGLVGKDIIRLGVNELDVTVQVVIEGKPAGYWDEDSNITDAEESLFIHAPADIAALIDEVKRLREENLKLKATLINRKINASMLETREFDRDKFPQSFRIKAQDNLDSPPE